MATVSTFSGPKRKKLVYGKLAKSSYSAASFFDEEDELATGGNTIERQSKVNATYTVQKTEARTHTLKSAKPRGKPNDPFDVPSSEDEVTPKRPVVQPPKYRPLLLDDTKDNDLAPWEKAGMDTGKQNGNGIATLQKPLAAGSEARTMQHTRSDTKPPGPGVEEGFRPFVASPPSHHSSPTKPIASEHGVKSAAARLAARRRQVDDSLLPAVATKAGSGPTTQKRTINATHGLEGTPRKRARTETQHAPNKSDVDMMDVNQELNTQPLGWQAHAATVPPANDPFDVPDTSDDETTVTRSKASKPNPRRGKLTTASRMTPRKGLSAPARLADMVGPGTDTTEAPTRSPSVPNSPQSSPQQPSTPSSARAQSPAPTSRGARTMTPKQANLWSRLLPSDPGDQSPSTLPIKELSISASRRTSATSHIRRLPKSQSDVSRRRTRLVDRLKAAAPDLADIDASSEDDSGDESTGQVDVVDLPAAAKGSSAKGQSQTLQREDSQSHMQSQSQSQSRTTSGVSTGPKITYARVRSYLPEDNLDADLMLGLEPEPPRRIAPISRVTSQQSQKSAYDLDDSEDEEGIGKMRSVHELRASGSNARGMGDIDELLDDIGKHNSAQRGTRRNALIGLATQLLDRSFKTRFIAQSCESRVADECAAPPDAVADTVLTAIIALLLDFEPPEHVLRSMQDAKVTAWLARRVTEHGDMINLVKDRRSNLSKSSQKSSLDLNEKLRLHAALWDEHVPVIMTVRITALKSLELLVRGLRRLGDRSELLDSQQITAVLGHEGSVPVPTKQLDLCLSMSVLESLSTTAAELHWSCTVVQIVADSLLGNEMNTKLLRHTRFLALRLCLNLTNDHPENCTVLSGTGDGALVRDLLLSIKNGFGDLVIEEDSEKKALALDLLVLAIGIMINLSEHNSEARVHAVAELEVLNSLVAIFQRGQKRMLDAESEEESVANVTFGYLAVLLANLCQNADAKLAIASKLPGNNVHMLVEAMEEFVAHHQKVDTLSFNGDEGMAVWSAFTEKLKVVLARLKEVGG